jgi:hypothetical protein
MFMFMSSLEKSWKMAFYGSSDKLKLAPSQLTNNRLQSCQHYNYAPYLMLANWSHFAGLLILLEHKYSALGYDSGIFKRRIANPFTMFGVASKQLPS